MIVRDYTPNDAAAFRDLNLAWVEAFFTVEDEDRAQLEDPQTHILDKGGAILIAEYEGEAVGTVGLVPGHGDGVLELIKMSARSDIQGKGIGRALSLRLASEGWRVAASARSTDDLESLAREAERLSGDIIAVPLDVRFKNNWPLAEAADMADWYSPTGAKGYTDFPNHSSATT